MIDLDALLAEVPHIEYPDGDLSITITAVLRDHIVAELRLLRRVYTAARAFYSDRDDDRIDTQDALYDVLDEVFTRIETPQAPATNDPKNPLGEKQ